MARCYAPPPVVARRAEYVIARPDLQHHLKQVFIWFGGGKCSKERPNTGRFPQQNGSKTNRLEGAKMGPVSGRGSQR